MTDPTELTDDTAEIPEDPVPEEVIDPVLAAQIMREGAVEDRRFLHFFYKIFLCCGGVGSFGCLIFGKAQAGSFLFGFLCMATILFLWHLAIDRIVKPRETSSVWQTLLVFVRYFLLGGVFYGIISLFVVRWPWFVAGTLTLLTGLLISTTLFRRDSGSK